MTAKFTEDNYADIRMGLRHLQSLLVRGGEVTIDETKGFVTVSGNFSEDVKGHLDETIAYLEKLFASCHITWSDH